MRHSASISFIELAWPHHGCGYVRVQWDSVVLSPTSVELQRPCRIKSSSCKQIAWTQTLSPQSRSRWSGPLTTFGYDLLRRVLTYLTLSIQTRRRTVEPVSRVGGSNVEAGRALLKTLDMPLCKIPRLLHSVRVSTHRCLTYHFIRTETRACVKLWQSIRTFWRERGSELFSLLGWTPTNLHYQQPPSLRWKASVPSCRILAVLRTALLSHSKLAATNQEKFGFPCQVVRPWRRRQQHCDYWRSVYTAQHELGVSW